MKYLTKYLVMLLMLLGLAGWLMSERIINWGRERPYLRNPQAEHSLDAEEFYSFLNVWDKAEHGRMRPYLSTNPLEEKMRTSWVMKSWLELYGWNVERFFYDELRIRELLRCVMLKNNHADNVVMAQKNGLGLESIIQQQEQQLKQCKYSTDELSLVEENISLINKVMPTMFLQVNNMNLMKE
ncbi:MAG: hypothetical protein IJ184_00780 [Alphaproteobacteria bacterium]|nr:hypothetical protein [Alphaproteobacteria bacterium]